MSKRDVSAHSRNTILALGILSILAHSITIHTCKAMKDNASRIRSLLGDNLRRYRATNAVSQEQLAERCNTTGAYISEVERGDKWPSALLIESFADALNVPIHALFVDRSQSEPVTDYHTLVEQVCAQVREDLTGSIVKIQGELLKGSPR